jgi:hypothetical protein
MAFWRQSCFCCRALLNHRLPPSWKARFKVPSTSSTLAPAATCVANLPPLLHDAAWSNASAKPSGQLPDRGSQLASGGGGCGAGWVASTSTRVAWAMLLVPRPLRQAGAWVALAGLLAPRRRAVHALLVDGSCAMEPLRLLPLAPQRELQQMGPLAACG